MGSDEVIVLDTHVFIWYALNDPQLDARARRLLEQSPRDVSVPSICAWEAMMLVQKGRLLIDGDDPSATFREFIQRSGFVEASLNTEIAMLSRTLEFTHEDPADRFIAATAYALGAKLATSDTRLRKLPWIELAY